MVESLDIIRVQYIKKNIDSSPLNPMFEAFHLI